VLKYIPAEIVSAYVGIDGVLRQTYGAQPRTLELGLWSAFIALLVLTPLTLLRVWKVNDKAQLFISTISFFLWVLAIGGAFALQSWYQPGLPAVILPIWTLLVPIIRGGP